MFLMIGVNDKEEQLDYEGVMTCDVCGAYGRYEVFLVCSVLYLFFIPTFRFNYRYYVRTSCCSTLYELDPEIGKVIADGERVRITEDDLHLLNRGRTYKKCIYCGYATGEDFEYCPKCGNKF
ncbi:MAG: zinc ribbon domain-containing protein [Erysipelotrichaceae bacterium]|nr:zinc ribbon domain-containing protein [Erysipelotrichaceae bacterium]